MKYILNIFTITAATCILTGCTENKPAGKSFKISGTLAASNVKMIYLEEIPLATMQNAIVDSSRLGKDGSFELSGNREKDMVYAVRLDKNLYPSFSVVNDTDHIHIKASVNNMNNEFVEKFDITNSPASSKLNEFTSTFRASLQNMLRLDNESDSLLKSFLPGSPEINTILERRNQLANELKNSTLTSIENAGNAALAIYLLGYYQTTANQNGFYKMQRIDDNEVYNTVAAVAGKFPGNMEVVLLKENLEIQRKNMEARLKMMEAQEEESRKWIGQPAPEIKMPDPSGKEISLSSLRGKYVLVDFWASWCGPCRAENPNVVAAFQKYRNKNFTILGVSLDRDKEAWTKAIMKDGLTWKHISDLLEWKSPVVPLYKINGIPYNVLLNPEGKIIAQNLRGETLNQKLAENLK